MFIQRLRMGGLLMEFFKLQPSNVSIGHRRGITIGT